MADVTTTFGAKDVGFNATVNRMQRTLAGFQSNLGGFATRLAGLAAAFVGVQQSVAAFNSALAMGGRLDDLSKTTGASAGELLLLEKAFSLAGSSAEAVGPAIARLNRFMVEASSGGAAQVETMDKLGLSYDQLKGRTPTEQMQLLAKSIMALPTPAQRTAAAMDIFGRSGSTLIPLFANFSGELDKAQGYLGSLPGLMDQSASAMADMEDDIGAVGDKFGQFVAGLVAGAAGADNFASALAKIDAAGIGANLGESLRVAFDAPKEAAAAVGYTLLTGVKEAGNYLIAAFDAAGRLLNNLFSNKGFTDGLFKVIEGLFAQVGATFISSLIDGIKAVMGFMNWNPLWKPFIEAATSGLTKLQTDVGIAGEAAANSMEQGALQMTAAFNKGKRETSFIYKDILGAADSADKAVESWTKAKDLSAEIRDNADKTAQSFGKGSAALTNALNAIRGFDLSPKEGPEARPDWTKSNQPPPSGGGGGSDKRGGGSERASERALTRNERIAEMQGRSRSSRNDERADRLEARGFFRSADSARQKAERQRNEAMTRGRLKDLYADGYDGARNLGEAYDKYKREVPIKDRLTEKQFDEMNRGLVNDQTKTPADRAAEEEAMRDKHAPKGGGKSPAEQIFDLLKKHIPAIDEKLPQTALVYS